MLSLMDVDAAEVTKLTGEDRRKLRVFGPVVELRLAGLPASRAASCGQSRAIPGCAAPTGGSSARSQAGPVPGVDADRLAGVARPGELVAAKEHAPCSARLSSN